MSAWTGITAVIRYNRYNRYNPQGYYEGKSEPPFLGSEFHFDSKTLSFYRRIAGVSYPIPEHQVVSAHKECSVPCGSEGSVFTNLVQVPEYCYVATIWGDLRDFGDKEGDIQKILDYLNRITEGYDIDNGICEIIAPDEAYTYSYVVDKGWTRLIEAEPVDEGTE